MKSVLVAIVLLGFSFSSLLIDTNFQDSLIGDVSLSSQHNNIRDFSIGKNVNLTADLSVKESDHLKDVRFVFKSFLFIVFLCLTYLLIKGVEPKNFKHAGIITILLLIIAGFMPFDLFFSLLHQVFFKSGTWTFSSSSTLIKLYPLDFWQVMGISLACRLFIFSLFAIFIERITVWCRNSKIEKA